MASSSRKKRARKGGEKKAGTGRNEKKKGTNNEKKLAAEVRDEKELAKERRNEVSRKRYAEDADYREKLLAYQREYKREHRGPPPPLTPEEKDKRNARDRERWATDPDYRAGKLVFHAENARRQELKRRYGLSWEDYQAMLARQGGTCAICKCEFTHTPFVDHCHKTRQVRRLLCRDCNTGLGRFKDDPHRVLAALQYLLEFLGDKAPFGVIVVPKHASPAGGRVDPWESARVKFIASKFRSWWGSVADFSKGRRIPLSIARRLLADYMWAASAIARVDVRRRVAFRDLIAARAAIGDAAPSWTAIFVKAFALVAAEFPELRRVYMSWPWPHFYQYDASTVSILQERQILGDTGILPLRFYQPDAVPLVELDTMIRRAAAAPIEASRFHRKLIALARLPLLLRRLIWTLLWNVPRLRREIGTSAVSSAARWQTDLGTTRSPLPSLLSYGPADANGNVDVRLSFDHRILDGALAGRALTRLDEILNSTILKELHELKGDTAAAMAPSDDDVYVARAGVGRKF